MRQSFFVDGVTYVWYLYVRVSECKYMKPFLKWVGGKRKLIKKYRELGLIPASFNTYYEPFLGGGAMFLHLCSESKIHGSVLSDLNAELVNAYIQVRDNLDVLKTQVSLFADFHRQSPSGEYYSFVKSEGFLGNPLQRAAKFIYINKSCRSGIWRVNKKGQFNVPVGKPSQTIYQPELLDSANKGLNKAPNVILKKSALEILSIAQSGDFAFIDPPYHQTYSGYNAEPFNESSQVELRDICKVLIERGVNLLISNSDTSFIREIYGDSSVFEIHEVERSGSINSNSSDRGSVIELAIKGLVK